MSPHRKKRSNASIARDETYYRDWERFIPKHVVDAAERFIAGELSVNIITPLESTRLAFEWYLREVVESGEQAALKRLLVLMQAQPTLIWHPYVEGVFRRLNSYRWRGPQARWDEADEWLMKLLNAWVMGMTDGVCVAERRKPKRPRQRPPVLFPRLHEHDGWSPSDAADEEHNRAMKFLEIYYDLHHRLGNAIKWKQLAGEFRAGAQQYVLEAVTRAIVPVLNQFKDERRLKGQPLSRENLTKIVQDAFIYASTKTNRAIRGPITAELMATLELPMLPAQVQPVTGTLVSKTVANLRKDMGADHVDSWMYLRGWVKKLPGPSSPSGLKELERDPSTGEWVPAGDQQSPDSKPRKLARHK